MNHQKGISWVKIHNISCYCQSVHWSDKKDILICYYGKGTRKIYKKFDHIVGFTNSKSSLLS